MSATAKPRVDKGKVPPLRQLKTLCREKPEIGEEIWAWTMDGVSNSEQVRDCIYRRHGIKLSYDSKLSEWRSWWRQQQLLQVGTSQTLEVLEWYRKNKPDATPEEIRAAQFMALAIKSEAQGNDEFQLEVLKVQGKDLDRKLNAERVAIQKMRAKAAEGVKEAGKKVQLSAEQIKEVLAAVDARLLGMS